jgi:hypothetical protein
MKFDDLYNKLMTEDEVSEGIAVDPEKFDNPVINNEDVREMIASVGWAADGEILLEPFDFNMWDEDGSYYKDWLESQPPEFVDFKKGAMEVMNYAKEYGATTQDLAELKKHLIELGKDYKEQQFFLYGIEADLSLGVI